MSVLIDDRQDKVQVSSDVLALVESVVKRTLEEEAEGEYEVSISFVDNDEIRQLNKQYRNIDTATDVLSFPLLEFEEAEDDNDNEEEYVEEDMLLGDIVISLEKAKEQAGEYGHSFERELAFLTVHGMLHLLGMDHENEDEEKEMIEKQNNILSMLNITR